MEYSEIVVRQGSSIPYANAVGPKTSTSASAVGPQVSTSVAVPDGGSTLLFILAALTAMGWAATKRYCFSS
jgi:hypothetical protein